MQVIKRVDVLSHKANQKVLSNENLSGIHVASYTGLPKIKETLEKYNPTQKVVYYEAKQDTLCGADYLSTLTEDILKRFPNFVLDLDDPELSLFVKEILRYQGITLMVATDIDKSMDGDFLHIKRNISRSELLSLLKRQRKLIIDEKEYRDSLGRSIINDFVQTSNDSIISTWVPKLIL